MAADTPRYLGRTHGYVDFASIAADPLEAVSAETQEELTRRAHVTWAKERQRRWGSTMRTINTAIADFAAGGVDRRVAGDLRQIRRGTDRVSRRLEEELRQADGG